MTQDLDEWQVHDAVELYGDPVVSDDGDEVTWERERPATGVRPTACE